MTFRKNVERIHFDDGYYKYSLRKLFIYSFYVVRKYIVYVYPLELCRRYSKG